MKKYQTLQEAAVDLRRNYIHAMPWMYFMHLVKHGDNRFFFNYVESLPSFFIHVDEVQRILRFSADWNGTNGDYFVRGPKKEDAGKKNKISQTAVALDSDGKFDDAAKELYAKMAAIKSQRANKSNFSKYQAHAEMVFREVTHVDMYEWGFVIETDTPIDLIAIKKKALRVADNYVPPINAPFQGTTILPSLDGPGTPILPSLNNLLSNLSQVSSYQNTTFMFNPRNLIGQELNLPDKNDDAVNVKLLGFWDYDKNQMYTDEEMDEQIFYGPRKPVTGIDVGQSTNKNIIL